MLINEGEAAKQQTNWPGGRPRASFGNVEGLNISSPIFERERAFGLEITAWMLLEEELPGHGTVAKFRKITPNRVGKES